MFIRLSPVLLLCLYMQPVTLPAQSADDDRQAVIAVIRQLFDGMRRGDSSAVRDVFAPDPALFTALTNRSGQPQLVKEDLREFLNAVGTPHKEVWDERVWSYDIRIDGRLASSWTPYAFFVDTTFSHCGVDAFQLFKGNDGWKIISLSDTRRRSDCLTDPEMAVHIFLDRWHKAAAVGDEDTFFGSMASDGIYIGTDASERWTRDEMQVWAQPYFDRDSAWAFTSLSRQVYFSDDGKIAWFDENLDTWMGICHGSGVLQHTEAGWKIKQYVLSVAVPNALIEDYLKLLRSK